MGESEVTKICIGTEKDHIVLWERAWSCPPQQRRLKRDTEAEHAEITVELSIKINIPRPGGEKYKKKRAGSL